LLFTSWCDDFSVREKVLRPKSTRFGGGGSGKEGLMATMIVVAQDDGG
jgi:hypothetical protein